MKLKKKKKTIDRIKELVELEVNSCATKDKNGNKYISHKQLNSLKKGFVLSIFIEILLERSKYHGILTNHKRT